MTDRPRDPTHPDALLAAYVDGSAGSDERAAAEAHLQACSTCREDLELARTAHTELRDLPMVEGPEVATRVAAVLGLEESAEASPEEDPLGARRIHRRERGYRAGRMAWAVGGAAAAALIGLGAYLTVLSPGEGASGGAAPAAREGTVPGATPAAIVPGFTRERVDELAHTLVGRKRAAATDASSSPLTGAATPSSAPRGAEIRGPTGRIEECLLGAGGLTGESRLVYLVQAATFGDSPAYIGAFEDPAQQQLVVIVADRETCEPLYSVALPI